MFCRHIAVLAIAAASLGAAHAQAPYPSRPVRLIVPFAPGGGTDIVARIVANKAGELVKQTIVVDNRGGAGGLIGTEMAVRAVPDGYTLGVVTASLPISATTSRLPYDPIRDLTLISMLGETGYLITVHPSLPIKTTKDLIAYAKANPGKVTYGSSGTGGTAHLSGELFDLLAGVRTVHVPYKSSGPALTDLLGGQISMIYGSLPVVVPHMNGGKLRVVSITTAKRSRALPNVPTIAESGVPGYESSTAFGIVAPAKTPRPIIDRLSREIAAAIRAPDLKESLAARGFEPVGSSAEEYAAHLRDEFKRYAHIVRVANIRLE